MLYLSSNNLIYLFSDLPIKSVYGSHHHSLTHTKSMSYEMEVMMSPP